MHYSLFDSLYIGIIIIYCANVNKKKGGPNMKASFRTTIRACFVGYIVQGIVNNFAPLLFLTFQKNYHIPLSQITLIATFNFGIQLLIDLFSAGFIDRIGYRASMVLAHLLTAVGFILLTILPEILPSAFAGILAAVAVYAIGGGVLEVLVSPVVEACPSDNKESFLYTLNQGVDQEKYLK